MKQLELTLPLAKPHKVRATPSEVKFWLDLLKRKLQGGE